MVVLSWSGKRKESVPCWSRRLAKLDLPHLLSKTKLGSIPTFWVGHIIHRPDDEVVVVVVVVVVDIQLRGKRIPDKTKQNKTKQNKTKQNKTKQNKTKRQQDHLVMMISKYIVLVRDPFNVIWSLYERAQTGSNNRHIAPRDFHPLHFATQANE
jgi:hypothetical protein